MKIESDTTITTGLFRLENRVIFILIINMISLVVTVRQLAKDTLWNVTVRVRDPDMLFSCSSIDNDENNSSKMCCRESIKSSVGRMYGNQQIKEISVLCFIFIGGVSAFTVIFIVSGFCVSYRSKHRDPLIHPSLFFGATAYVVNCLFFLVGILLRRNDESNVCNTSNKWPSKKWSNRHTIALSCLHSVLLCRGMDSYFKYWHIFLGGLLLLGLFLLILLHRYSKAYFIYFCQSFVSCSSSNVAPLPSSQSLSSLDLS